MANKILEDGTKSLKQPTKPSRLMKLSPYALCQLSNGLLNMMWARRPKVHRVAYAMVAHVSRFVFIHKSVPCLPI